MIRYRYVQRLVTRKLHPRRDKDETRWWCAAVATEPASVEGVPA